MLARGAARRYCAPGSRRLLRETEDTVVRLFARSADGRAHVLEWAPVSLGPSVARAVRAPLLTPRPAPLPADPAATPTRTDRRAPTPAELVHRARLKAKEETHIARRRALQAYNAQRRAAAVARAGSA